VRGSVAQRGSDLRTGRFGVLLAGSGETHEECNAQFVISARKTSRLGEELRQAERKPSPKTDGNAECEFRYQPVPHKNGDYEFFKRSETLVPGAIPPY
jgi:hypothetical protein